MDRRHYDPDKLKAARTAAGKTQQGVANELKVDRQTIFRAEAGTSASFELLASMCLLYGLAVTDVVLPHPDIAPAA